METQARPENADPARGLEVRLLGPVRVWRGGTAIALPRSRKVVALLAVLALEGTAQLRSRLCDLLWDAPNDPRGELRWCLSKLRAIVDEPARPRVVTGENATIALDLSDAFVDVAALERTFKSGVSDATTEQLLATRDLWRGELLEGLEVDGGPELGTWVTARRQRYRAMHLAVVAELARRPAEAEERGRRLDEWVQLAPFEHGPHEAKLQALLEANRRREAEEHLAAAIRGFEAEGVEWAPLRAWWHDARKKLPTSASASAVEPRTPTPSPSDGARARRRASVAVMPFVDAPIGHGLTDDVITRLAKLRAFFVIARGTTYALGERGIDAYEAGRILDVEYVVSGRVRRHGERVSVVVELAATRDARIVWTDELVVAGEATFGALDAIVDRIVAAIAEEVETAECERSLLKPPSSLDAWEAYHRGLWHMYKFKAPHNDEARRLFQAAIDRDPTFARAYAGLSFTHFQNVFLELTPDREQQIDSAFEMAAESLRADERDPTAHWAMGRALWLRGAQDDSVALLRRSIELSPSFALGHYTLGFVEAQSGDPRLAIAATDTSRALSPFDPLQFGMLASRALAHVRLGDFVEANQWALKAIGRPNAHTHILATAASTLALNEKRDDARALVARIRERIPSYDIESFLRAFRFDRETEALLRRSAKTIGFDG